MAAQAAQAKELSDKYFGQFSAQSSRVGEFSPEGINELKTEDLIVGDGDEVKGDTKIAAYYLGWNPSGKIFDGSIDGDSLKAPFAVDGPADAAVIEGWQKGLVGMKIGGIKDVEVGRRENRLDIKRHRHDAEQIFPPPRRRLRACLATIDRHRDQQHIV